MDKALEIKEKITAIKPLHDTALGRIHPYWARKPLNIIRELIKLFSNEGDIVCDPFMGCGTTVFGSLLEKRSVIGTDINPLASLIVQGTLSLRQNPEKKMETIKEFVRDFNERVSNWFYDADGNIIERERYSVNGRFENGDFNLVPSEAVLKVRAGNHFKGKKTVYLTNGISLDPGCRELLESPVNYHECKLVANSRIAIPQGALLSHYFTEKNIACINSALKLIDRKQSDQQTKMVLQLFLSSTLPLLRLSDYKASSQWPYWRPKSNLTSRNPVFVFHRRFKEFQRAQEWLLNNMPPFKLLENSFDLNIKEGMLTASIQRLSIQEFITKFANDKVDLVLTDPPYSDQIPYLEYSSLWIHALKLHVNQTDWEDEIVKTDAKGRQINNLHYLDKLLTSFEICADILKDGGYLIWFYQDSTIKNWAALYNKSREKSLNFITVIPMPKQRRSMKTVTTPGRTFDGDLILVFQKNGNENKNREVKYLSTNSEEIISAVSKVNDLKSDFFFRYAELIQDGFKQGWISKLPEYYNDIRDILR